MLIMLMLQFFDIQRCLLCNIFCLLPPVIGVARQQTLPAVWKISHIFRYNAWLNFKQSLDCRITSDHLSNAFSFHAVVSVVSSPLQIVISWVHRVAVLLMRKQFGQG